MATGYSKVFPLETKRVYLNLSICDWIWLRYSRVLRVRSDRRSDDRWGSHTKEAGIRFPA